MIPRRILRRMASLLATALVLTAPLAAAPPGSLPLPGAPQRPGFLRDLGLSGVSAAGTVAGSLFLPPVGILRASGMAASRARRMAVGATAVAGGARLFPAVGSRETLLMATAMVTTMASAGALLAVGVGMSPIVLGAVAAGLGAVAGTALFRALESRFAEDGFLRSPQEKRGREEPSAAAPRPRPPLVGAATADEGEAVAASPPEPERPRPTEPPCEEGGVPTFGCLNREAPF